MSTINQLSAASQLSAGDLLAVFSTSNGDARKVSISVLAAYIQSLLTPLDTFVTQYVAPNASGFSVSIGQPGLSTYLLLTPTGAFAAGTITLPAVDTCVDGQQLLVSTTQAVTALTVAGNGATVNGAPTTLAANAFFRLRFDGVSKVWFRVG